MEKSIEKFAQVLGDWVKKKEEEKVPEYIRDFILNRVERNPYEGGYISHADYVSVEPYQDDLGRWGVFINGVTHFARMRDEIEEENLVALHKGKLIRITYQTAGALWVPGIIGKCKKAWV